MPERTRINVDMETYQIVRDYAAMLEKQSGVKPSLAAVTKMLLQAGYKSKTGKDYKPKGRG